MDICYHTLTRDDVNKQVFPYGRNYLNKYVQGVYAFVADGFVLFESRYNLR
jgi:hypothetical protein